MIAIHDLLAVLGPDADAVASFLAERDFRGVRGVGEDCPLANYLRANGIRDPAIDATAVTHVVDGRLVVEDLPQPAEDFVMLFDDGAYPDLSA